MRTLGFNILSFAKLRDWRILEVDGSIPFSIHTNCPSDDMPLKTMCTLVGNRGAQKIRIGTCSACGYTGYIDRPTKEWVTNFYVTGWDRADTINLKEEIEKRKKELAEQGLISSIQSRGHEFDDFIKKFLVDRNRPVLEIGCGYGGELKYLEQLGFKKLVGIENSHHRAQIAHDAYGIKTIATPFEDAHTQEELKKDAPFHVIVSRHVLEHVYDPGEVIRLASDLQREGDYMMLALPNIMGEPSMQTLLFVPHLHSFSLTSLTRLLNRYGYEVVDNSRTGSQELNVIARKISTSVMQNNDYGNAFQETKEKFTRSLGLNKKYLWPVRLLWWHRWLGIDEGGQLPFWYAVHKNLFLKRYYSAFTDVWIRYTRKKSIAMQSCVITSLPAHYVSENKSPIEIHFSGNILLTYK